MFEILCVTSRALCREDFLTRLERLAAARPAGIILREKDLSPAAYRALARAALDLCASHGVPCILHTFVREALELGAPAIHLPLPALRSLSPAERRAFSTLGASCHSAEDAAEAEALGCHYITAGHVFDTACKAGMPGRGLDFLREVCRRVSIPVYAIGGITAENAPSLKGCGMAGIAVVSAMFGAADIEKAAAGLRSLADAITAP